VLDYSKETQPVESEAQAIAVMEVLEVLDS
jgi:hypothetical protein